MSKVSKVVFVAFTQHCIQSTVTHVGGVEGPCCMLHGILQHCTNTMSKVSKVVFVAFTQHCIQSTVTHVGGVEDHFELLSTPLTYIALQPL